MIPTLLAGKIKSNPPSLRCYFRKMVFL
jgi:hypothetical protein